MRAIQRAFWPPRGRWQVTQAVVCRLVKQGNLHAFESAVLRAARVRDATVADFTGPDLYRRVP